VINPFPSFARRHARATASGPDCRAGVLFYADDGAGLGHLRRLLAIAGELARRRPDAALLALTPSFQTHAYALPPNFDYVKLPDYRRQRIFPQIEPKVGPQELSPGQAGSDEATSIVWLRSALIRATAEAFAPTLVLVDVAPAGTRWRELLPTLDALRSAEPRVELVLGLRDILQDGPTTCEQWRRDGVFELLERTYDRILVYGQQEVFDPIAEYGFPPAAAAKTTFVGYLGRSDPVVPASEVRRQLGAEAAPLVVVTTGGGADGDGLIRAYLAALRSGALPGVVSLIVRGPYSRITECEAKTAALGLIDVTMIPVTDDLLSYFNAADLVVAMGGYNTCCEVVGLRKRAVIVPRAGPRQEQRIRAKRFAARGLLTVLYPDELSPERLACAARAALDGPPPPAALDLGGLGRVGAILEEALGPGPTSAP
jgi:predicted glycosyltransferase